MISSFLFYNLFVTIWCKDSKLIIYLFIHLLRTGGKVKSTITRHHHLQWVCLAIAQVSWSNSTYAMMHLVSHMQAVSYRAQLFNKKIFPGTWNPDSCCNLKESLSWWSNLLLLTSLIFFFFLACGLLGKFIEAWLLTNSCHGSALTMRVRQGRCLICIIFFERKTCSFLWYRRHISL